MIETHDPLAPLDGLCLPHATYAAVARLLVIERLIGGDGASAVEHFAIGPEHAGARPLELAWKETLYYSNVEPGLREIRGVRVAKPTERES